MDFNAYYDYLIKIRRHLHIYPEEAPNETNTCLLIKKELENFSIPVQEIEKGGLIAHLKGKQPGHMIALRADMDALPVEEDEENLLTQKVCVSSVKGVSHACGHDAHVAMLLTTAKILKEKEELLFGEILFVFERGEETHTGYQYLLPILKNYPIEAYFGIHVYAGMASNQFAVLEDACMSGNRRFRVTVQGKGCHGALPHQGIDPLLCVAEMVTSLQTQMLRSIPPTETATFCITEIHGGSSWNVMPDQAYFSGGFRFFNPELEKILTETLERTITQIAAAHNCTVTIESKLAKAVTNDRTIVALAKKSITKALGESCLHSCPPWMASETFAFYLDQAPGAFAFLGIQNIKKGTGAAHHNAKFDLDEEALLSGVTAMVQFSMDYLNEDLEQKMRDLILEKITELKNITVKPYIRSICNAYLDAKEVKNEKSVIPELLAAFQQSYEEDGCKKALYLLRYPQYM